MNCLEEQEFLVRRVGASGVGGWCSMRKGVRPGACILLFLIRWMHAAMNLLDWTHVYMVQ